MHPLRNATVSVSTHVKIMRENLEVMQSSLKRYTIHLIIQMLLDVLEVFILIDMNYGIVVVLDVKRDGFGIKLVELEPCRMVFSSQLHHSCVSMGGVLDIADI